MYRRLGFTNYQTAVLQLSLVLLVLYWTSFHSYLLFHSLVEIAGVIILLLIFVITWNARRYLDNSYFLIIGIASLFVGAIAVLHLLAFKGLGVVGNNDSNIATQLWLAERYVMGTTFLVAPFFIRKKINVSLTLIIYIAIFLLLLLSIFDFKNFPVAWVDGKGLTDFKKNSEYIISFLFLAAAVLVYYRRVYFDKTLIKLLILSFIFSVASEISFTEYVNVYGFSNMLGHLFLIVSFFLLYLGIIELALRKPSRILYKKMRDSKYNLEMEVQKRTAELQNSYISLKKAYKQLELRNTLRKLAISSPNKKIYFDNLLNFIREQFEVSCVGVREINEQSDIPYSSCLGFSRKFWKLENQLSLKNDQCICTRVFKKSLDPHEKIAASFGGSFYCKNTSNFYASLTDSEQKRYRGTCFQHDYKSLAVVPVFENGQVIATIHMADKKVGIITKEKINLLESITYLVSIALNKFNSDQKLEEYKRALLVLSEGNRILVHAESEKKLVNDICEMVIKAGGFVGAWIGYPLYDAKKSIKVVTQSGLNNVNISKYKLTWDKKDHRTFPARYAIITGKTQVKKYITGDPDTKDFQEFSKNAGFRSLVSIPLKNDKELIGALTIFSKKPDTFHKEEIKLLEELASDLAYGINTLRTKNAHQKSLDDLVESYKHLGIVNRKISLLIDMGKDQKSKSNKEIAKYVVNSALSMSHARFGILYRFEEDGKLHLISAIGLEKPIDRKFIEITSQSYDFLKAMMRYRDQIEGDADRYNLGMFSLNNKVKCFLAIPLKDTDDKKIKGFLYLGFTSTKTLSNQELEFYDVFIKSASQALIKAGLIN